MDCLELSMCGQSGLELMSLDFQSVSASVCSEAGDKPVQHGLSSKCVGAKSRETKCCRLSVIYVFLLVPSARWKDSLLPIQPSFLSLEKFVEER